MARSKPPKQSFAKDTRTTSASESTFSAFHPSLPLFAYARLSLDAWHIRVLDPSTSQARNEYALDKGVICRCLAWGNAERTQPAHDKSKKKQKLDASAGSTDGLLATGLSDGSIQLLSPSRESAVRILKGGHTGAVTGLSFTGDKLWSVGEDGKAIQWHTPTGKQLEVLTIDSSNALRSVAAQPVEGDEACFLAASYIIQQMSLPNGEIAHTYTNHTSPVHTLLFATSTHFISAAEDDRYMNLFTLGNATQDKSFVAEADVRKVTTNAETLCAATSEGFVEIFDLVKASTNGASTSKRRKSMVASASCKITIQRPESGPAVPVLDVSIRPDGTLLLGWLEGARVVFESVPIRDVDGQLSASVDLVRAPKPALGAQAANGQSDRVARPYQDGQARIAGANEEGDFEMADAASQDQEQDADVAGESEEDAEPTLQERLHALEVSTSAPAKQKLSSSKQILQVPSAGSLTTVLTQALKSSDTALLESCLHQSDSKIILATVRRLDPVLSVALLEELAKRLARRPGRAGELGVWVRWTIVVHGGYLSSLPNLVKTLSSLHATLSNRAATLPRLLALQGRLDMVHAQIELRREGGSRQTMQEEASDVEYNEGDSDFSDEEEVELEDASELGGLDSSDEGSVEEDSNIDEEEGDFSDDSEGADAFAQLDADMEAHAAVDDVESEEMEHSDDEAEA